MSCIAATVFFSSLRGMSTPLMITCREQNSLKHLCWVSQIVLQIYRNRSMETPPTRLTWILYKCLRSSGASEAGMGALSAAGVLL